MKKTMTINSIVKVIREVGIENSEQQFGMLYERIINQVEQKAKSFLKREDFKNFSIDVYELVSYATYEWLLLKIEKWDMETGTFEGYYFRHLENAFMNAVKPYFAKKRQTNLKTTSLDQEVGDGITLADILEDIQVREFSESFINILNSFGELKGEQARKVILCHSLGKKTQITNAICQVYSVDTYNSTIRKRVQRIKNDFETFYFGTVKK